MMNDKIIELSENAKEASESRKQYETPVVTVVDHGAEDVIMMSREPGETPFVPMLF